MSAISYNISVGANSVASVTTGTLAPSSGSIELRMDQTATAITDMAYAGGQRAVKKGEILVLMKMLEAYLIGDTNVFQG